MHPGPLQDQHEGREHHGYDDPDLACAKARRNAALAELELARLHALDVADPVLARVALDVGRSHVGAGAPDLAVAPLRLAQQHGSVEVRYWAMQFLAKCASAGTSLD